MDWRVNVLKKLSAKSQIALGQSGLIVTVLLMAVMLGLVPDRIGAVRDGRAALAEALAANSSAFLTYSDLRRINANLELVRERNDDVLSAALRRADGNLALEVGEHKGAWQIGVGELSTDSQLVIPIHTGEEQWGTLELRFTSAATEGLLGMIFSPAMQLSAFVGVVCFILFYFYLGRMLAQLDPSQAIPGRVRSALDTMAEGLLVLDQKQQIVLANLAFAEMLHKDAEKLVGTKADSLPWREMIEQEPGDRTDSSIEPARYPWVQALKDGEARIGESICLELPGEKLRVFNCNSSPVLGANGKYAGVLVSFDDVTELEEKKLELSKSKQEADAANAAKSDFLANMSHEIRTPMNAILGFTEVLQRGYSTNPASNQKHLSTILNSGRHLLNLINDILDLSKVEADRLEVEEIECAAHEVIAESVKVLKVKAEEKGIFLEFKPEGYLPETVLSDSSRLRQIVTNLVGNAIKFTESGGVTVGLKHVKTGTESLLQFDIIDTGIGMQQDRLDNIFDPFVQADTSVTRKFGGTGLGLSISKRFAEALGGGIVVSSEPGSGSTFSCTIKTGDLSGVNLVPAEELMARAKSSTAVADITWVFPSSRVLVVDDGEENRELVRLVLEENGIDVEEAGNGQEGADLALAGGFDVVLMDVQMPVMDGFEATKLLRASGYTAPIVALTANAMKGFEQQCLDAGYSSYMSKPINIDLLLAALADYLGATQSDKPAAHAGDRLAIPTRQTLASSDSKTAIHSRLTDGRFNKLIVQFIARFAVQLENMRESVAEKNHVELANLAHWLKGAGGTVGFDVLTDPAAELELAAKAGDEELIAQFMAVITDLAQRLSAEQIDAETASKLVEQQEFIQAEAANEELSSLLSGTRPIVSRFAEDSRMAPLVEKFQLRLVEQLQLMQSKCDHRDFAGLADLAHWLKGAGGTIGYDVFTEPAAELETSAKEENLPECRQKLDLLSALAARACEGSNKLNSAQG